MEKEELIDRLNSLIQLDIDAIHAYCKAIDHITDREDDDVRGKLAEFRDDHQGHVEKLSAIVSEKGGQPPNSPDLKGLLIEGFTALRSVTGTKGALEAMEGNEKLTNKKYGETVDWDVPDNIKMVLKDNLLHEQRHLAYIQMVLTTPRREM